METSVDPNTQVSLLSPFLSAPFARFQPFVYLRRARARVSRPRKCVSRVCVRAQCQGVRQKWEAWVFTVPISGLPSNFEAAKEESRNNRSTPHSSAFFLYFLFLFSPPLFSFSHSNFGIGKIFILSSCIRCISFFNFWKDLCKMMIDHLFCIFLCISTLFFFFAFN